MRELNYEFLNRITMKAILFFFAFALALAACNAPEPTQTTVQDTVKVNNPDTMKLKKDTLKLQIP